MAEQMSTNGMERRLPGTVYVTLDDGYTCFFPVFSLLMRDSGYFKKILEERPGLEHFSHDLSLPRVRRDLWLPFEKFIMSRVLSLGDIPSTYRGIKEMALAGQNDIIRGKLDLEIYLLLELMLLSDRLDAPAFEKEVMDQLLERQVCFYREHEKWASAKLRRGYSDFHHVRKNNEPSRQGRVSEQGCQSLDRCQSFRNWKNSSRCSLGSQSWL